jgi:hypothetical protein
MEKKTLDEDIKQLVIARLSTMPPNIGIAIGSSGNYSTTELIKLIEADDEVGIEYAESDIELLRALKDGVLYE